MSKKSDIRKLKFPKSINSREYLEEYVSKTIIDSENQQHCRIFGSPDDHIEDIITDLGYTYHSEGVGIYIIHL